MIVAARTILLLLLKFKTVINYHFDFYLTRQAELVLMWLD